MFNTLFEHFSFYQSLLKEWRRPPTGWLIEAKESLGKEVSMPLSLWVRSETTFGASVTQFPLARGKRLVLRVD